VSLYPASLTSDFFDIVARYSPDKDDLDTLISSHVLKAPKLDDLRRLIRINIVRDRDELRQQAIVLAETKLKGYFELIEFIEELGGSPTNLFDRSIEVLMY